MAYLRSTSSTTVRLNGNLARHDLIPVQPPADGSAIVEGAVITIGTDGRARLAVAGDNFIMVNYVDSARSDVMGHQADPNSGASINIDTGGLTGILLASSLIGVPATTTYFNSAAPTASSIGGGKYVSVVSGKFNIASIDESPDAFAGRVFGVPVKLEGGIFWMCLSSTAQAMDIV